MAFKPELLTHDLGKRISQKRREHRMTQQQLSDLIHISRTTIGGWERGQGSPMPESLLALSVGLDVTADWLLTGRDGGLTERRPYFPLVDLARGLEAGDGPVTVHIGDGQFRVERIA